MAKYNQPKQQYIYSVIKIFGNYIEDIYFFTSRLKAERKFKQIIKKLDKTITKDEMSKFVKRDLYADDLNEEYVQLVYSELEHI